VRALVALVVVCTAAHLSAQETDLTPALTSSAAWDSPPLAEGWGQTYAQGSRLFRTRTRRCQMLGREIAPVTGCFENGRLTSFSAVFLDSGAWFGYVPDEEAKSVESARGPEFQRLFREISADVSRQLPAVAGSGREVTLGSTQWLKEKATIFTTAAAGCRLVIVPDQLVKVTVFRDAHNAGELLAAFRRGVDKSTQGRAFAGSVRETTAGDRFIDSLPVFPQGDRAYCGVSVLASVMQFCGLTLDTEDFAAAAGIRFGSTHNSHLREVYVAAARDAALQMFHSTKFEFARAKQSIDAGFPVMVFRRWNQERDYLHTAFRRRFAADPTAQLPRPDATDQKTWPIRGGFAHASVVNGYNLQRREVIFTESWSEAARNRRMRVEELEATSYLAYYPRL